MSMLLYADDIILMANGARDLQRMLDMLDNWCKWWGLCVNPRKTKFMQFRPHGHKMSGFMFTCEDDIDVVEKYKYLGLWFTDKLDLNYMAEQVAASAQRALGLLIAKSWVVSLMTVIIKCTIV